MKYKVIKVVRCELDPCTIKVGEVLYSSREDINKAHNLMHNYNVSASKYCNVAFGGSGPICQAEVREVP